MDEAGRSVFHTKEGTRFSVHGDRDWAARLEHDLADRLSCTTETLFRFRTVPLAVTAPGTPNPATGEDIDRDFPRRLGYGIEVRRLALLPEHVEQYGLPRSFDIKEEDPRNESFLARHGGLWQTELDALDPDLLRELFMEAFGPLWNMSHFEARLGEERDLLVEVLGEAA